jgi:hypothetical protein
MQVQADEVLPDEHGQPGGTGEREGHGAGDDQGGDQTSRDEQHDQEDRHEGGDRHDSQIGCAVFLDVLIGRSRAADINSRATTFSHAGFEILKTRKLIARQQISETREFAKCVVFQRRALTICLHHGCIG